MRLVTGSCDNRVKVNVAHDSSGGVARNGAMTVLVLIFQLHRCGVALLTRVLMENGKRRALYLTMLYIRIG